LGKTRVRASLPLCLSLSLSLSLTHTHTHTQMYIYILYSIITRLQFFYNLIWIQIASFTNSKLLKRSQSFTLSFEIFFNIPVFSCNKTVLYNWKLFFCFKYWKSRFDFLVLEHYNTIKLNHVGEFYNEITFIFII